MAHVFVRKSDKKMMDFSKERERAFLGLKKLWMQQEKRALLTQILVNPDLTFDTEVTMDLNMKDAEAFVYAGIMRLHTINLAWMSYKPEISFSIPLIDFIRFATEKGDDGTLEIHNLKKMHVDLVNLKDLHRKDYHIKQSFH